MFHFSAKSIIKSPLKENKVNNNNNNNNVTAVNNNHNEEKGRGKVEGKGRRTVDKASRSVSPKKSLSPDKHLSAR